MTLSPEPPVVLRDPSLDQLPVVTLGTPCVAEPEPPAEEQEPEFTLTAEQIDDLRAEGFVAGEQSGRRIAESEQGREIEAAARLFREAAEQAAEAHMALRAELAATATDLALQIAELVLQRELSSAQDPGREAIVRCLAEVEADELVAFHLNPADIVRLGSVESLLAGRAHDIVPDDDVLPGDCLVRLAGGSIDGSLRAALARVEEVLR